MPRHFIYLFIFYAIGNGIVSLVSLFASFTVSMAMQVIVNPRTEIVTKISYYVVLSRVYRWNWVYLKYRNTIRREKA